LYREIALAIASIRRRFYSSALNFLPHWQRSVLCINIQVLAY